MNMKKIVALGLGLALTAGLLAGCSNGNSATGGDAGKTSTPPAETQSQAPADNGGAAATEFPEMKLSLGHTAATSHAHNVAAELFAQEVSDMTGGKVTVTVYPASELGDQPSLLDQCYSGGDVDIAIISQSNMAQYMPKLNALAAPFLFDDYDHAHKVIDNYVMDWINQDIGDQMNMHALSMFDYGFRHVTTQGIEVNTAADMAGVKIRVPGSAGLLATFDALGSNTQTIAYSELYQSLKQGVVAAEENPIATILADCYYECQDQLALTGHFFDMQALLINKAKWDSMSPELQAVIQTAATDAQNKTRELISGGEADAIAELEGHGMNVTNPDKQSFIDMMDPAYAKIAELCGQNELDALLAAVAENK